MGKIIYFIIILFIFNLSFNGLEKPVIRLGGGTKGYFIKTENTIHTSSTADWFTIGLTECFSEYFTFKDTFKYGLSENNKYVLDTDKLYFHNFNNTFTLNFKLYKYSYIDINIQSIYSKNGDETYYKQNSGIAYRFVMDKFNLRLEYINTFFDDEEKPINHKVKGTFNWIFPGMDFVKYNFVCFINLVNYSYSSEDYCVLKNVNISFTTVIDLNKIKSVKVEAGEESDEALFDAESEDF